MATLNAIDFGIVIAYTLILFVIGFRSSRGQDEYPSEYFLAGRKMGWLTIGASLFVTNISSEHLVGLASSGAQNGLVVGHFEWMAIIALLALGWFFAPLFLKAKIYTIPEFLEMRFNRATRIYLTAVSIFAYVLTKIAITLFAGGLLLNAMLGWDIYTSALVMVVITGIYTIVGGLRAVMNTHVFQMVVLLAGSFILTTVGLNKIGGFGPLLAGLPDHYFDVIRSAHDPHFPWTGIVFGAPILAVWYWCTDQYIVQRVLSAKDLEQARTATIFTGFLKLLPAALMILPGMVAVVMFPGIKTDEVISLLFSGRFLPVGLRGIVLAGFLAALMSSLASVFNSTATLFTMDFYRLYDPQASERKLVLVGRLATTIIVITAILWIPLTRLFNQQIYLYLQSLQAYIAPPIAAVFLFGVFSNKINARGALYALIAGGIFGALRLALEMALRARPLNLGVLQWLVQINFLHFAILLFIFSSAVLFMVSWLSGEQKDQTTRTVFSFSFDANRALLSTGNLTQLVLSVFLVALIFGIYGLFF
ncbi:sodium:solute symporter [Calditrichota bacterium GD2]